MKALLYLVAIVLIGCAAFRYLPALRETVRTVFLSSEENEGFSSYRAGRRLFAAAWKSPDGSRTEFQVWGDDAGEDATLALGDVWLARGHLILKNAGDHAGAGVRKTWCIAYNRQTGEGVGMASGPAADETIRIVKAGGYEKLMSTGAADARQGAPGGWMWGQHRTQLDQTASKH